MEPYELPDDSNSKKMDDYMQLYSKNHVMETAALISRKDDFTLHLKSS